jgi:Ribbon-helix-helix protein, copG family
MLAYAMKRTTVKISDDLDARVRHEAERRGMTVSEFTREALEAHLSNGGRQPLSFIGLGDSRRSDVSARIEQILAEEFGRPEHS